MAPSSHEPRGPPSAANLERLDLDQTLLSGRDRYGSLNTTPSLVIVCDEKDITKGILGAFKNSNEPLGVSIGLSPRDQTINTLAIVVEGNPKKRCLIIQFSSQLGRLNRRESAPGFEPDKVRQMIQDVLCRPAGFCAFDLAPLALALYRDLGIRVSNGVDIQSAFSKDPREKRKTPLEAIVTLVGEDTSIQLITSNIRSAFADLTYDLYARGASRLKSSRTNVFQRAWVSQFLTSFENAPQQFAEVPVISTTAERFTDLACSISIMIVRSSADLCVSETRHPLEMGGGFHSLALHAIDGNSPRSHRRIIWRRWRQS